jgi:DNA-nicking Smr family endonuclease
MTKKKPVSEDSDLFREAIGQVRPIKKDKINLTPSIRPKPYPSQQLGFSELELHDKPLQPIDREGELSFIISGIHKNVLTNLRQGYFGIDAEIDLHGLTANEAQQQLHSFLQSCIKENCLCVHVVHGKGYRSSEHYPILKNKVNLWLRQHPHVQAFCSAAPKDGGAGALYVLLEVSAR